MPKRLVYILEDDADVLDSLLSLLRLHEFEPVGFRSAHEFLSSLEELAEACLLIDIRLPLSDGISVLREVREKGKPWPAIFMTGHPDTELAALALKSGALDVLEKPFDPSELVEILNRADRELARH
jgi:FixJ family two-component response regulator